MDGWQIAEKLALELEIGDPGYVYYHLMEVRAEYRDKYPGHWVLCLPGEEEVAVLPDGTTDNPYEVFKDDYPSCREPVAMGPAC